MKPRPKRRTALFAASLSLGLMTLAYGGPENPDPAALKPTAHVLRVPLDDRGGWRELRFGKIPPHALRFTESGLKISVNCSAMPLIYPLRHPVRASAINFKGRMIGSVEVAPEKQGKKGYDDYALRVGLVEPGTTTLTARERRAAPDWVKALFDLAPAGRGIEKVHFLNLGVHSSEVGRFRQHPMSKLLEEEVVAAPKPDGSFEFVRNFNPPTEVCAIWISVDGDDTKSSFQTVINQIELETLSN